MLICPKLFIPFVKSKNYKIWVIKYIIIKTFVIYVRYYDFRQSTIHLPNQIDARDTTNKSKYS